MNEKNGKLFFKMVGREPISLTKAYTTVGQGTGYDVKIDGAEGAEEDKLLFAIEKIDSSFRLIPGQEKITLNGKPTTKPAPVGPCDRIEWKNKSAVILDANLSHVSAAQESVSKIFEILESVAGDLDGDVSISSLFTKALSAIVAAAGAEEGYLISEVNPEERTEWAILASVGDPQASSRRKELISSTILNDAIQKKTPLCIESLIGHPLARQASIVSARIFSVACLPLRVGQRIFGAVYLHTHTPGRSIKSESLKELTILSTQVALLMAYQAELRRLHLENRELKEAVPVKPAGGLVYQAAHMRELHDRLIKLSGSDLNIIIRGETGTGKELLAREIHRHSPRARGPFVIVNCAAIPPSLIESVLFGHTKGAYTGAQQSRAGKFLQANNGTIFLDEIGELPLEMQVKLLRVLQEKEIEAVGSDRTIKVDFRVVAATHQDLERLITENKFRQDLFFRLNGAPLSVPALRDRGAEEILLLAKHFLERVSPTSVLSEEAKRKITEHGWPGNVRELEQVIARGAVLSSDAVINAKDLELQILAPTKTFAPAAAAIGGNENIKVGKQAYMRDLVDKALQQFGGNRAQAAKHLGISERTLYRVLAADSSGMED
jgi:transcriptional regulator with GAF, ATPase, and Fis domain